MRRLARMVAGAPGEAGTGAGLVYQLWITESARARAEVQAMRLPGNPSKTSSSSNTAANAAK